MNVDLDKVIEGMRLAVQEKGDDYVYPRSSGDSGCAYFEASGSPSCLVGWGLAHAGINLQDLLNLNDDRDDEGPANSLSSNGLFDRLGVKDARLSALRTVQYRQDTGAPWGEAIEALDS